MYIYSIVYFNVLCIIHTHTLLYIGQAEIDTTENWGSKQQPDTTALNMAPFQDIPTATVAGVPSEKHVPFQQPHAPPSTLISGPNYQPTVIPPPTSQGQMPTGVPMDWAQLQVQMQLLSQQNPIFFPANAAIFLVSECSVTTTSDAAHSAAPSTGIPYPTGSSRHTDCNLN